MAMTSPLHRQASAGAFANVFVFGTLASTIAFSLGATSKALPRDPGAPGDWWLVI